MCLLHEVSKDQLELAFAALWRPAGDCRPVLMLPPPLCSLSLRAALICFNSLSFMKMIFVSEESINEIQQVYMCGMLINMY